MKKDQWISFLLSLFFAYSLYNWSVTLYGIFTLESFHLPVQLWINFTIFITGVAALIQFYSSGFKRSQFLRAYLIYLFISFFFSFMFTLFQLRLEEEINLIYIRFITVIPELAVIIIVLNALKEKRTPRISAATNEEGVITSHYIPSELYKRFLNRLLDFALLAYIVYSYYDYWLYIIQPKLYQMPMGELLFNNPIVIAFFPYPLLLLYYIVMEYFFRTTFGKVITGTTIVKASGGYPELEAIIGRSFCRFIPADAISFFFSDEKRGWHDKLSGTGVVEDKYVSDAG